MQGAKCSQKILLQCSCTRFSTSVHKRSSYNDRYAHLNTVWGLLPGYCFALCDCLKLVSFTIQINQAFRAHLLDEPIRVWSCALEARFDHFHQSGTPTMDSVDIAILLHFTLASRSPTVASFEAFSLIRWRRLVPGPPRARAACRVVAFGHAWSRAVAGHKEWHHRWARPVGRVWLRNDEGEDASTRVGCGRMCVVCRVSQVGGETGEVSLL